MERQPVKVSCYAGYKGEERPVSFTIEGTTFAVQDILDRWYDPDANYFRVRLENGTERLLRRDLNSGEWELVL